MENDKIILFLPIHPEWVDKILSGEKTVELRKHFPDNVAKMMIYSTSPVRRVVGYVDNPSYIHTYPGHLWTLVGEQSCVRHKDFFKYFHRCKKGYAINLDGFTKFRFPVDVSEIDPDFHIPMMYCRIEPSFANKINKCGFFGSNAVK